MWNHIRYPQQNKSNTVYTFHLHVHCCSIWMKCERDKRLKNQLKIGYFKCVEVYDVLLRRVRISANKQTINEKKKLFVAASYFDW